MLSVSASYRLESGFYKRFLGAALVLWTFASSPGMADTVDDALNWSGSLSLAHSRNIFDSNDYRSYRANSISGQAAVSGAFGKLKITLGGEQDLLHERESTYYDPYFEYSINKIKLSDSWSFKVASGVYLPLSKASKKDNFQYAFRLAPYFYWDINPDLSFLVSPRYQYFSYKYKTAGGRVLKKEQLDLVSDLTWGFYSCFYFNINGRYRWSKNYYGRKLDDTFYFSQAVGWEFMPDWEVSLTHNNSGRFYNPEYGPREGLELYDSNTSTFDLSLTYYL